MSIEIGMLPTRVDGCDWTYYVDPQAKTGEMPCKRDLSNHRTTTFWVPDTDIPIDRPADTAIHVLTLGLHPQVEVGFARTLDDLTLEPRPSQHYPHNPRARWVGILLTDDIVDLLNADGYFALRVSMAPPPPVSVWIS